MYTHPHAGTDAAYQDTHKHTQIHINIWAFRDTETHTCLHVTPARDMETLGLLCAHIPADPQDWTFQYSRRYTVSQVPAGTRAQAHAFPLGIKAATVGGFEADLDLCSGR